MTTQPMTRDLAVLAALMERLDASSRAVNADQYLLVARRLGQALARAESGDALNALLDSHLSAAEAYENLQYQHAGLCRSPQDAALAAELAARKAIDLARRATPAERDAH